MDAFTNSDSSYAWLIKLKTTTSTSEFVFFVSKIFICGVRACVCVCACVCSC